MNCLSEVNYGMFCSQRFMLKLWLATEQGGLLLNMKWTVTVCWHHNTCCGIQDYSAWPCSRGMTVTWLTGTEGDHWHWVFNSAFGNTFHTDTYHNVYAYNAQWYIPYCLRVHFTLLWEYRNRMSSVNVDGWHLGNNKSSWSYKTYLYFFDKYHVSYF